MPLVLAGLIGLLVPAASWCFLEAVHEIEVWVYETFRSTSDTTRLPWWSLSWVQGITTSIDRYRHSHSARQSASRR